jgi:predicted  nucleic acid-binding Zn-ribbon protein
LNPQLTALIELQTLDLRISEIKEQRRKIPTLIQAAEAPLTEGKQQLQSASALVQALVKERRDRERDLDAHEAQIAKMRGRLTELKTNKEYQAHLFEIEMANKKKGEIEEQILTLMERIDKVQGEVNQAQAKAADAERAFVQEKSRLEESATTLETELIQLEQKHKEAVAKADADLLGRYMKLKASRKEVAVVPVRDGICTGCRLQLPPQLIAEVKRSQAVHACTYCHRILYWEGEPVMSAPSSQESLEDGPHGSG